MQISSKKLKSIDKERRNRNKLTESEVKPLPDGYSYSVRFSQNYLSGAPEKRVHNVIVSFSTESGIIMVDFLEDGFNPSFKLMIKYFGGDCKHVTFTIASFIDYQCKEFPEEKRSHVLKDRSDCGGMALMFQKNMMGVFQFGHQLESKYFREANADCFPKNKPENKNKYMSWLRKQFQNIENRYEPLCEAIFHEDFVSPNKKKKREKVHFDRI